MQKRCLFQESGIHSRLSSIGFHFDKASHHTNAVFCYPYKFTGIRRPKNTEIASFYCESTPTVNQQQKNAGR